MRGIDDGSSNKVINGGKLDGTSFVRMLVSSLLDTDAQDAVRGFEKT